MDSINILSSNYIAYNHVLLFVQMWRDSPVFMLVISGGSMLGYLLFSTLYLLDCYNILLMSLYHFQKNENHDSLKQGHNRCSGFIHTHVSELSFWFHSCSSVKLTQVYQMYLKPKRWIQNFSLVVLMWYRQTLSQLKTYETYPCKAL